MLLADMGADVVRVEWPGLPASSVPPDKDVLRRNRRSIVVDLHHPDGVRTVLSMAAKADVLLEGFRPGVTERLGLGPADCWPSIPDWSTAA
jgi:alpha-methylacyl-CoA racemase